MKKLMTLAALLLTLTVANAANTVTVKVNPNQNAGSVESSVSEDSGLCTLTVTPAQGYFMTVDGLQAVKVIDAGSAQAPNRVPSLDSETIAITAVNAAADPSGVTTYTFQMPSQEYDVEVTATFSERTSIASATVTVQGSDFVYDGEEKAPRVTVALGEVALDAANYEVSYANNINAGTATVTVTGKGIYTGTASAEFTIAKASLEFSVNIEGWNYGQEANEPNVEGETGEGEVVYMYKLQSAGDDAYTIEVPMAVGDYVVRATIAETDNYQAGEATAEFSISRNTLDVSNMFGGNEWATYVSEEDLDLGGVSAYVVTGVSGTTVQVQALEYLPAGVPVLLQNTEVSAEGTNTYKTNLLQAGNGKTNVSSVTDGTVYVLYNDAFVLSNSGVVPANRAYLVLPSTSAGAGSAGAPRRLTIGGLGDTTGISSINAVNGSANAIFDLQGRRTTVAGKGLYIINSKKVILK